MQSAVGAEAPVEQKTAAGRDVSLVTLAVAPANPTTAEKVAVAKADSFRSHSFIVFSENLRQGSNLIRMEC